MTFPNAIKLAVAFVLIAGLTHSDLLDFDLLTSTLHDSAHFLGLSMILLSLLLQALRWQRILRTQGLELGLSKVIELTWIGGFFSLLIFGQVGGDGVRAYYLTRHFPDHKVLASASIIWDRAFGLCTLLLIGLPPALMGLLSQTTPPTLRLLAGSVACCSLLCLVLLLCLSRPQLQQKAKGMLPSSIRRQISSIFDSGGITYKDFAMILLLSLLATIFLILPFVSASDILQLQISSEGILLAAPMALAASTLPIAPAGLGVGEAAAAVLFLAYGIEQGATLMLLVRIWNILLRMPGGLVYIIRPQP